MRIKRFAYAKTKAQNNAFVFATQIIQFRFFLNTTFPASSHLLCLYSSFCVGHVRNSHCWLSHAEAHITKPETQKINRIHHGWSVEIGKSQPEGPSVPVGNEARRVSHWNDGPEG